MRMLNIKTRKKHTSQLKWNLYFCHKMHECTLRIDLYLQLMINIDEVQYFYKTESLQIKE